MSYSFIHKISWSEVKSLIHVQIFATPWTVAYQAPPSMEFSRQECLRRLPFPSPGDHPHLGIKPRSPALQADSFPSEPINYVLCAQFCLTHCRSRQHLGLEEPREYATVSSTSSSDSKASTCNAGDLGSIPGSGKSPREGNGNPL